MKLLTLAIILSIASGSIVANAAAKCSKTNCIGTIDRLYLDASKLYIEMKGNNSALDCKLTGNSQHPYVYMLSNHRQFDQIHGMLLGAYLSGQKAMVRVVKGQPDNQCQVAYVVLDHRF